MTLPTLETASDMSVQATSIDLPEVSAPDWELARNPSGDFALREQCRRRAEEHCGHAAPAAIPVQGAILDGLLADPGVRVNWRGAMNGRAENCPDDLVLMCAESGDDALAKRLYSEVHGRVRYSTLGRSLGEGSTDAEHEAVAKMLTSEGRPNLVVAILGSPVRSALCVAWVRRAARNRAIDILRSADFRNTLYGDAPESDHPVTSRKPTDWGETQLDAMTVRAGMLKLRQTDRELLTLYFIEECDYDDLSRILNKPVGNLRVAVSRAIGRLGRLLREPGTARREHAPTK